VLRNKEKAEQEKLDKEAEVERMKPREDLKLGDSKGLPVPVPLKILVSEDLVGGVQQLRPHFGPYLAYFSALSRAVGQTQNYWPCLLDADWCL